MFPITIYIEYITNHSICIIVLKILVKSSLIISIKLKFSTSIILIFKYYVNITIVE